MKKIFHILVAVFGIALVVFILPPSVCAATHYEDKIFTQSVVLKRINHPYYFGGQNSIARGVTVTFEKGTEINIEGVLIVSGKLILAGESASPIKFNGKVSVIGGELHASHVDIKDVSARVEAFATSTVIFDSVHVEKVSPSLGSSVISVFNNSTLTLKNSTFSNLDSTYGIEVFNGSSISVQDTTFTQVGSDASLLIYGENTTASISESLFYGISENLQNQTAQQSVQSTSQSSALKAIEIFSGALLEVSIVDFERFSSKAISAFANATLNISKTTFTKNKLGIESYNSNVHISDCEIFGNIEGGATIYGGNINAMDNWWGSDTGPKSITLNPNGTGDIYRGTGQINPWKQLKPKKKEKCCSSVLFIPGHQGSRIYKSGKVIGLPTENQLWEPNTVSDISKLGLNTDGYSIDKTLYTRDIIDRTNIVYGGSNDVEIYKGLVKSLNGLNSNYSIEDWQYAAYDWRMSPNTIVVEGAKYGSDGSIAAFSYKKIEDQIVQMADVSKTKKVTLLAHSYGGLVTKRLLAYLLQRGKISLIDKVIFVAVPENGSPSSLFALLHGDNQDIGNGYIVDKSTMRKFAQNMPSVYALLPKSNSLTGVSFTSPLIFGMQATNTVSLSVPTISTTESMYKFLFNEITRPSTIDVIETNIPLVANKKIKQKIDIESTPHFIKPQTEQGYEGIEFYNILGVGLNTPQSISYTQKPCTSLYTHASLMSPNCGLNHVPNFSQIGDGVVLADDVLGAGITNDSQGGRWGEKYVFNMGEYNRRSTKNYSHANIASAPPVISTFMQIIMNTIGEYALPTYVTKHGGNRMGGSGMTNGGVGSSGGSEVLNQLLYTDVPHKKYQISTSDSVLISGKNILGQVMGVPFSLLSTNASTSMRAFANSKSQILPIVNTSPNSDTSHFGNSYYIHTETLPSNLNIVPDRTVSQSEFSLLIKEITPVVQNSTQSSNQNPLQNQTETKIIASFENIPITEYSTIEVKIDPASTTQAQMIITDSYDDVYTNTAIYTVTSLSSGSPNAVLVNLSGTNNTTGTNNGNSVSPQISQGGSVDIMYLIGLIRTEIQKSGVRANFKQRYILKLNTIEKNYKSLFEVKRSIAKKYSKETTASLAAILKDLQRSRSLYYRGGMRKSEVAFLYSQFLRLSQAFGN